MSSRLNEGKVAIVTGAGGGIGREIALALADSGARVVINDIGVSLQGEGGSASPAEETLGLIRQRGGEGLINTDSVADWDSARRIVECAMDGFGRLDIVVNNAGILRDAIFHKMSADDWLSVINVHLNGSFFVSRKSIALDMQRYNVRSNCIAPFAWSRMTDSIPAETPEQKARVDKLQRMTPEKNAPLAVYLASDAAREVTGQVFAARHHELFLMSQSRPLRSVHSERGWTPESIAEHGMPALRGSFMDLARSPDVFSWDPI
ncbi:SDR family oxidoreductase [Pseudomonas aeruginosa]|nr:SDR family oxidoreductase [Pseudomonas aeruginosa]